MPTDEQSLARQAHWGMRLRERRKRSRLSGYRLAKDAGISRSYLKSLEAGEHSPSDNVREQLARALDTTPEELFPSSMPASRRAAS